MFTIGVRPQGDLIVSGSFDSTIKLWNWQTGECVRTLVGVDNRIWLWNEAGECLQVLAAHAGIWRVTFHPHDRMLASVGFDGEIELWDIDTGCCLRSLISDKLRKSEICREGEKDSCGVSRHK